MNDPAHRVERKKLSLEAVDSLDTLREEMHEAGQRQMGLNDPTGYNSSNVGKGSKDQTTNGSGDKWKRIITGLGGDRFANGRA